MSATFGGDDGRKDPQQLEREIEATRNDVGDTLDALQARLSPGQLLDQGLRYVRGNGGQFIGNLGATMRDNPVPVILTGIGLAWMMVASRNPPVPRFGTGEAHPSDRYAEELDAASGPGMGERLHDTAAGIRDTAGSIRDRVTGTAADARDRVTGAASTVSGGIGSAADSARNTAHAAADRARRAASNARWQAQRTRNQFSRMMDEQPLVLGAMGVALGALLGALVPATAAENELMGEARDRLADTARAAAEGAKQALDETITSNGSGAPVAAAPDSAPTPNA